MDFSRIFIFEPPDFFADFLAGFFLLIFVGKSAQKNPQKILQILYNKNPRHISAEGPGQELHSPSSLGKSGINSERGICTKTPPFQPLWPQFFPVEVKPTLAELFDTIVSPCAPAEARR